MAGNHGKKCSDTFPANVSGRCYLFTHITTNLLVVVYCRRTFIVSNMYVARVCAQSNNPPGWTYMYLIKHFLPLIIASLLVSGCAFDVYRADLTPAQIDTSIATKPSFRLREEVDLDIGFGYERQLMKGTVWNHMGAISHGDVYHSSDQILTVEASNIYEAYLVVLSGTLVGFYLPVEDAYYPLANPTRLPVRPAGTD